MEFSNFYFSEFLVEILEDRQITQSEFAKLIRDPKKILVSNRSTVSNWVHGRHIPDPESYKVIISVLRLTEVEKLAFFQSIINTLQKKRKNKEPVQITR